ncbi:MAG: hypothetical protein RL385_1341 [Pseudomonadota bacterium]|jgi:putative DNA primase/helicase
MTRKRRDANDVVRDGGVLDPASAEPVHLTLDGAARTAGLGLTRTESGAVRATTANAVKLLSEHPRWHDVIGYDAREQAPKFMRRPPAFGGNDEQWPRAIRDTDVTAIIKWMEHETDADFAEHKVNRAIDLTAHMRSFDPVCVYLKGLRWDGRSRLDDWLATYLGAEPSPFARMVGAKFLISAVARALRPGCQVDHVLVLEGRQGSGKTSALRILGGDYHRSDLPPLSSRDAKEALRGAWIVELGELASLHRSEVTDAKNFISTTVDTFRLPYGRRSEPHPRRVVFAASTNETEYLRDQTGNRRFWPVMCNDIDLAALALDRDQLWAEAVTRFDRSEPWHLGGPDEVALATSEQDLRREADPWEESVASYAAAHRSFTASEILRSLGVVQERQTQSDKNRVGRILQRLGYTHQQVRVGDQRVRQYVRADSTPEPPLSRVSRVQPQDPHGGGAQRDLELQTRDTRDSRDREPGQ